MKVNFNASLVETFISAIKTLHDKRNNMFVALVFLAFLGSCKSYNKSVYEFKNEFGILPVEGELPVTLRTKYFDITYSSSTTKKLYKLKTKISANNFFIG